MDNVVRQDFTPTPNTQKSQYTAHRILFILQMLLRAPASKDEILAEISSNPSLNSVSKDSIALDISTLKQAGFVIESAHKGNNYRYSLVFCPLKLKFSREEFAALNKMKHTALELSNWRYIVRLYEIFYKFSKFIENDKETLLNFDYFLNIDLKLLRELNILVQRKKEVVLSYNSPNSGIKSIALRLESIEYDCSKLHVLGVSKEYGGFVALRADNILAIEKILKEESDFKVEVKTCKFRIKKSAFSALNLQYNEAISNETEEFVEINGKIFNEFLFVQRLIGLGFDCVYIENSEIRNKVVEVLKNTLELYK